ncbi:MAG TPA: hypothetical protein VIL77_03280 [Gaiellaceae bacterium]
MNWRWIEERVDQTRDHPRLVHDDCESPVAVVGPPNKGTFPVHFLVADDPDDPARETVLTDVRRELDLYLLDVGRPDPWAYAHYHCGTFSNARGQTHWGEGEGWTGIPLLEVVGDPFGDGQLGSLTHALAPLVQRAWQIHRGVAAAEDGKGVESSMPILFFGDLSAYWRSTRRIVTVGLNPSDQEFPTAKSWSRFRRGSAFSQTDDLDAASLPRYLGELSAYFAQDPYRRWFDRSFEPLLHGLDASYYPIADSVALHTDLASPVATSPTWNGLKPVHKALHRGGAQLWRDLVDVLAPDVIVLSVARHHLSAVSPLPLEEWDELTRIERERPFVVKETTMPVAEGRKVALAVVGRCTNVPFGSVSFPDRERIGRQIAVRLDERHVRAGSP